MIHAITSCAPDNMVIKKPVLILSRAMFVAVRLGSLSLPYGLAMSQGLKLRALLPVATQPPEIHTLGLQACDDSHFGASSMRKGPTLGNVVPRMRRLSRNLVVCVTINVLLCGSCLRGRVPKCTAPS